MGGGGVGGVEVFERGWIRSRVLVNIPLPYDII
jgi:hypothetical protein